MTVCEGAVMSCKWRSAEEPPGSLGAEGAFAGWYHGAARHAGFPSTQAVVTQQVVMT